VSHGRRGPCAAPAGRAWVVLALALLPGLLWAQEPPLVHVEGGEREVRPEPEPAAPLSGSGRFPGARTVITRAQFADTQRTVADVLETVPGVTVVRSGDALAPTRVSIRGSRPDQVLIVVDGVPQAAEQARPGAARAERRTGTDLATLSLAGVESIEVVRGAASSLYGPGAAAGAVIVRTRRAKRQRVLLERTIGTGGYRKTVAEWDQPLDGFTVTAALNHRTSRGEYVYYDPAAAQGTPDTPEQEVCAPALGDGYRLRKCNATEVTTLALGLERGARRWWLEAEDYRAEGLGGVENARPYGRETRRRALVGLTDRRTAGEREVGLEASLLRLDSHRTENTTDPTAGEGSFTETRADGELWAERWWGRHQVRLGAAGSHQRLDDRYFEAERGMLAATARWNAHWDRTAAEASLRRDHLSDLADRTTGRAGVSHYLNPAYGVKGSAGTGYRPPTLYELYDPGSPQGPSAANPDLRPESSASADAGAFVEFPHRLYGEALYFHTETDDAIVAVADPASPNLFRFANIARTRATGVEASLNARLPAGFRLDVAATLTRAVIVAGDDDRERGNRVPGVPEVQWSAEAAWRRERWHAYLKVRHRDPRYVDAANTRVLRAYRVVDGGLSFPLAYGFEGALDGTNLTGETYAELDNHPAPGRQLQLTVRWRYEAAP